MPRPFHVRDTAYYNNILYITCVELPMAFKLQLHECQHSTCMCMHAVAPVCSTIVSRCNI
jgi:hypothetical protein|eukprot:COSAG01_NODE_2899_length_6893_cov_14.384898_2_plen_60_part_00